MMSEHRSNRPLDHAQIEAMLRAGADSQIEPGTGRVAARVRARMSHSAPVAGARGGMWQGFASLAAACLIIVAAWFVIGTQNIAPLREPRALVRLTSALDHSATAIRGARPEQSMMTEVKRLRHEVERGVGFVKAVIPKVRING